MQMLDKSLIPRPLLLIVLATSLRCLDSSSTLPDQWANECRRLVMSDIFSLPSIKQMQILVLLQRYEWNRGAHISAWIFSSLAVRLAHILRLNIEIQANHKGGKPPVIALETRRRLMWSCLIIESMREGINVRPLSGLDTSSIEVNLPCDERSYQCGQVPDSQDLGGLCNVATGTQFLTEAVSSETSALGISAWVIRVMVLRMQITKYTAPYHPQNKDHIPCEAVWEPGMPFYRFQRELDGWLASLPLDLQYNLNTLHRHGSQMVMFLNLHCIFHAAYCDLFRLGAFLTATQTSPGWSALHLAPPEPFLQHCRRGRLRHAFEITKAISETTRFHVHEPDPFVAMCACLAIRVLVIEHRRDDSDYLNLTDDDIRRGVDAAVKCAKRTARWSKPVLEIASHLPNCWHKARLLIG
jgi:hypothetical protein